MLVDTESEFWQKELEKIKDPISGAYYFYINYIKIERNGKTIPVPFITESDFNKVFEQNAVELRTRSRRKIGLKINNYGNSRRLLRKCWRS